VTDDVTQIPVAAIHLDAVGGVAGDMFSAALLDIRPDLWPRCEAAVAAMDLPGPARVTREPHGDSVLTGLRFRVDGVTVEGNGQGRAHQSHIDWRDIRGRLERAPFDEVVREAALGIFGLLAEAEAAVHGKVVDEVTFHEVGAVDSIADILSAAAIATALAPCIWSVGPLPRGRGQVRTAHGFLPVPAPAVLELLKGYVLVDDGEEGERITPTGAAILRYLGASQDMDATPRRLIGAGVGFGARKFVARSNILRATLYGPADISMAGDHVEILRCEIDDQTAEDLAAAIDHLRAADGVIDVCQWPVFGKKGRMGTALQVIAEPGMANDIAALILDETTTLGVRRATTARDLVAREALSVGDLPVKLAQRPSGVTSKVEMDALAATRGVSGRQTKRYEAELKAIQEKDPDGQ